MRHVDLPGSKADPPSLNARAVFARSGHHNRKESGKARRVARDSISRRRESLARKKVKPVYQTKFGKPDGNCFIACVASILECSIDDFPDLCEAERVGQNWIMALNDALRPLGWGVTHIPASEENPAMVYIPKGCHFIASGDGRGGLLHSVVYQQKDDDVEAVMVHDPIGPRHLGLKKVTGFQLVVKL